MYVGKATDLRHRVRSHLNAQGRGRAIAAQAATLDLILTRTPYEAAVLESSLIRHHRPPLNRADPLALGFWYLRLSDGPFPRLERFRPDRGEPCAADRTFGPCVSYREAEDLIAAVSDHFRLRTCRLDGSGRCARAYADHCIPVCDEPERRERYARAVAQASRLLRGDTAALAPLRRRIAAAAAERRFETAAALARRLRALERGAIPQSVVRPGGGDAAVACARRCPDGHCRAAALRVQGGALIAVIGVDAGPAATAPAAAQRAALRTAAGGLRDPVIVTATAGRTGGGWVTREHARGLLELALLNLPHAAAVRVSSPCRPAAPRPSPPPPP